MLPQLSKVLAENKSNNKSAEGPNRESKGDGKITHIHIHAKDDGSYGMSMHTDKGMSYESSHPDADDVMKHVHDHLTSPHLPKLGSGERFANLKNELSQKPGVTNPGALSAWIGRKKFGKTKFQKLAAAGK